MKVFVIPTGNIGKNKFSKERFVYICFNDEQNIECDLLKKRRATHLKTQVLLDVERKNILHDYVNLIGEMSILNGMNREWWATDIASKNRILSPLQGILNQIVSSTKAIEKCEKDELDLYIIGAEWPVIAFLKAFSESKSITLKIHNEFLSKLHNRLNNTIKIWSHLGRGILSSLLNIIRTRIAFGKVRKIDNNKPVFLIKSWIFPRSFTNKNQYNDPFCGKLALDLKNYLEEDVQIVTISQGFIDRYKCYQRMKGVNDRVILPVESFLHFVDVLLAGFSIAWYLMVKSMNVPKIAPFLGHDLNPMLKDLTKSTGRFIRFSEYLYYYIGRRLATRFTLQGCLMSYEGNHWEKMFILGIRSINQNVKIIGYHHSAISQASAGVFLSKCEILTTPSPDRIVTTGTMSANIIKEYSFVSADRIWPGCALLYQYLYDYKPFSRRHESKSCTILVMLEGVFEASKLLDYAINQAHNLPTVKFVVRSHPSLPFEVLLQSIGKRQIELPMNLVTSNYNEVSKDVERCDVGLYWGTATAVEALMMGKPIIWFNRGDVLSFDPLFDFSEFKWTVQFETPISKVLEKINNLTDEEYRFKSLKGIEYVSQYFEQCNEKNIKSFVI